MECDLNTSLKNLKWNYLFVKCNISDVGYMYQHMETLRQEEMDNTQEYSETGMDATLIGTMYLILIYNDADEDSFLSGHFCSKADHLDK